MVAIDSKLMAYPNLVMLEDHGGDFANHLEAVYACYLQELVHAGLSFQGKVVSFKYAPATDEKGFAFWHAVSEQGESGAEDDRIIDLRRCERISWPAYMLSHATADGQGDVLWWISIRNGRRRPVLWLKDDDYALVLEERDGYHLFWTTYTVRPGRARTFAKEHAAYWAAQQV